MAIKSSAKAKEKFEDEEPETAKAQEAEPEEPDTVEVPEPVKKNPLYKTFEKFAEEFATFKTGNNAAGGRARKLLLEHVRAGKALRKQIQAERVAAKKKAKAGKGKSRKSKPAKKSTKKK